MLVLSRMLGEKIVIQCGGEIITIAVADIRRDKVRIGVEASKEVRIDREEIYEQRQREIAANTKPGA